MMKKIQGVLTAWLFVFLFCLSIHAREKIPHEKYLASSIPSTLSENADAVCRYETTLFEVTSREDAKLTIHRIVTILNEKGNKFNTLDLQYDKFTEIDDLDGVMYDADGKKIRSLNSDDIKDYSATASYSLYDDIRIKEATLQHDQYPYTVEFEYVRVYDGYLSWPTWSPEKIDMSVEYSKFEVTVPKENKLRYWKNIVSDPVIDETGKYASYVWVDSLHAPIELEPMSSYQDKLFRCVKIAPTEFELDDKEGNLSSWAQFGHWCSILNKDRQVLPDQECQKIINLVAGVNDKKEQVRIVYKYFQSKTRYISVQLGIGGWQPFDASYVSERGYGDCKALTNYMLSLLQVIGIKSYQALIQNSYIPEHVLLDFPNDEFDHVILYVPLENEKVWLECTNQNMPFGHIGTSNENRYALVINSDSSSSLIKTPTSLPLANSQKLHGMVTLSKDGYAVADIKETYNGDQQDYVRDNLRDVTPEEKKAWLLDQIDIPSFTIIKTEYPAVDLNTDSLTIGFSLNLPQYAVPVGRKLMFQPKLLNRRKSVPKDIKERKYPIVNSYPYIDVDTVTYKFPASLTVESKPKPVSLETSFAKFYSETTLSDSVTVLYVRYLEVDFTELPPEMYTQYRDFIQSIVLSDKGTVILSPR